MVQRHQHFDSIDGALKLLRAELRRNPFFPNIEEHEYQWLAEGERGLLVPTLVYPFLYRGQTERHQPCRPQVFRDVQLVDHPQRLPTADRARLLLRKVRLEEFLTVLDSHPASAFARDLPLVTYPEAIAQHYEVPTDRIDLSQDLDVAAFFATNRRGSDGRWDAIEEGTGVLYRLGIPSGVFAPPFKGFEWIGRQALPRPGEQRAWTLCLPLGRDFESLPVDIFTFVHDRDCGRRFLEKYDAGRALFPPDVLSALADQVKNAPTVPRAMLRRVLTGYGLPAELHESQMQAIETRFNSDCGASVDDRDVLAFSPEQRAIAHASVAALTEDFKGTVRAVRAARPWSSADGLCDVVARSRT